MTLSFALALRAAQVSASTFLIYSLSSSGTHAAGIKQFSSPINIEVCASRKVLSDKEKERFLEDEVKLVCISGFNYGSVTFKAFWTELAKECQKLAPNTYRFEENRYNNLFLKNNFPRGMAPCVWTLAMVKQYGIAEQNEYLSDANARKDRIMSLNERHSVGDSAASGLLLLEYIDASGNAGLAMPDDLSKYYSFLKHMIASNQSNLAFTTLVQSRTANQDKPYTLTNLNRGLEVLASAGHAEAAILNAEVKSAQVARYADRYNGSDQERSELRTLANEAQEALKLASTHHQSDLVRRRLAELERSVSYATPSPLLSDTNTGKIRSSSSDEDSSGAWVVWLIFGMIILGGIFGKSKSGLRTAAKHEISQIPKTKFTCYGCHGSGWIWKHGEYLPGLCGVCHGRKEL